MQTEGAIEMVRRGYTESTRCLGFRVQFYADLDGVREAVRIIGQYNDFVPDRAINAVDILAEYIPAYGSVYVGREGSPVMYFALKPEVDHALVKAVLEAAMADEIDFETPYPTGGIVRAWWD